MNTHSGVSGVRVGHAQNLKAATGCTAILTVDGAVCGIDQRGGAPCTRDTDKLRPMHLVDRVHGILLTGGSTFGLSAADGVVKWLEEGGYGFDAGVAHIPIVPSASLFDLKIGSSKVRPDAEMGIDACKNATENIFCRLGSIGAGTGATIGGIMGKESWMKGGLGVASIELDDGIQIGAIFAVNCFGDVLNPSTGKILAGACKMPEGLFIDTMEQIRMKKMPENFAHASNHTVIGVIATNASFNKEEINKIAQMAHNGLARVISPANTMFDGDTIFSLATCKKGRANVNIIGALAAEVTTNAIINAIEEATSLDNVIALRDIIQLRD